MCFSGHEEPSKIKGRKRRHSQVREPLPSRPSLGRVAEALARPERSAWAHAEPFGRPTLQWVGKTTCSGGGGLVCSSCERSLPSSIGWCLCGRRHPGKRGSGHFCTETLLTGDDGENEKPTHVKLVRPLSWCCVAEGMSARHKSSNGHATGVVPNSLAEPWACAT